MSLLNDLRERWSAALANRGIKAKLISIFVVIKVLPVVLLAWTAAYQVLHLGSDVEKQTTAMMDATRGKIGEIGDLAVKNSVAALDARSREAIEELTTNTARNVAAFLYDRDRDISYAASLPPNEHEYRRFLEKQNRAVIEHGAYRLDSTGEKWVPVNPDLRSEPAVQTGVKDNQKEWHYRPPERVGTRVMRPLYLEMTYIDLNGNEKIKISTSKLLPTALRNVSSRANTYCRAETYFADLKRLKPGEITVSEVIGPYVGSPVIGTYTPKKAKEKGISYAPEQAGYAGRENPVGKRFRGVVRWGMPVVQGGAITGYVTLALDHRHLKEFTDHLVPTEERLTEIADAASGNYAFIWDYKGRSIVHPRDYSIVGYDPATGEPAVPWLDAELYKAWKESGLPIGRFLERQPTFHQQSLKKKPSPELTRAGFVGLDGRYLNFAPQCIGWHELTSRGGSGSFVIFWSGLWKLTTAATIPYYTGRYGAHPRGFGYVTIGANVDEFHEPAAATAKTIGGIVSGFTAEMAGKQKAMRDLISSSVGASSRHLTVMSLVMIVVVIVIAVWMAGFLTRHLTVMIAGIRKFKEGELATRLPVTTHDELGALAEAFNGMAGTLQQREEALRKSEEKYRQLVVQAHEGVVALDSRGMVTFANPRMSDMLGYENGEMIGKPFTAFMDGDNEKVLEQKLERRRSGVSELYEIRLVRKCGAEIDVSISASPNYDDTGVYIGSFGVLMDITERKRAEELLAQKQEQLEILNQTLQQRVDDSVAELRQKDKILISQGRQAAMGEMIGNIAHQWRQPLNALSMLISNIQYAHGDNELTAGYLDESAATANRLIQKMSATINDFRNFFSPDKEVVHFSAVEQINNAVRLIEAAFKNSGIDITVDTPRDCTLNGFPNEYSQVLLNLFSNCKEAIQGGGHLPGSIVISLAEQDGMGVVTVLDNGGGIPEPVMDKIFEPYFSTKNMGTGIGLYMSKMIVERNMGGVISVRNRGNGAEFSVSVPLAEGGYHDSGQ